MIDDDRGFLLDLSIGSLMQVIDDCLKKEQTISLDKKTTKLPEFHSIYKDPRARYVWY